MSTLRFCLLSGHPASLFNKHRAQLAQVYMSSSLLVAPSSRVRTLGSRLTHLYQWALDAQGRVAFSHIWDLCCDHGRLGLHIHQSEPFKAAKVNLVDCVPSIIELLEQKYQSLLDKRLAFTCLDVKDLKLTTTRASRHLVIIAGVSGSTVAELMQAITRNIEFSELVDATDFYLEFLLSPNLQCYELREFLRNNNFEVLNEAFVTERGRCHEHLHLRYHVNTGSYQRCCRTGQVLWAQLNAVKSRYLNQYFEHYQRCYKLGNDANAKLPMLAYGELLGRN